MNYYLLNLLGDVNDSNYDDYCFAGGSPSGLDEFVRYPEEGIALSKNYPEDPWTVTIKLDEDRQGIKLSSYIGNTNGNLIVKKDALLIMQKFILGECESFPFTLINHKNRVHSKDYLLVNPLGTFDCLDFEKSKLMWESDHSAIGMIMEYVLDPHKLGKVPDLFRIEKSTIDYVFSERLVNALREASCTNFGFDKFPFSKYT